MGLRRLVHRMQAMTYQIDVVHSRKNREQEGGIEEESAGHPHPMGVVDLKQHNKQNCRDLRKRIGLAENAGAKVAESCDGIKHAAHQQNANIPAKNQDRIFPRNEIYDGKNEKGCAQQQLVGDGVQVLTQQCLLMQAAGQQSVQTITEPGEQRKDEGALKVVF